MTISSIRAELLQFFFIVYQQDSHTTCLVAVPLPMETRSLHAQAAKNDISARSAPVLVGCFSSSKPLSNQGTYKYQSSGYCSGICTSRNQGVVGLSNGNNCWCGSELPAADTKVLDARCNTPCQGYGIEDCTSSSDLHSSTSSILTSDWQVAAELTISLSGLLGSKIMCQTTSRRLHHRRLRVQCRRRQLLFRVRPHTNQRLHQHQHHQQNRITT